MITTIIIACKETEYAMLLSEYILRKLDDRVRLHVVTDSQYLLTTVMQEQKQDTVLILGREYYYEKLDLTDFSKVFLLDEQKEALMKYRDSFIGINRYLKPEVIYDLINDHIELRNPGEGVDKKGTKIIAVYSPIGGIGTTTIAYGLCKGYAHLYKKVLYINPSTLQDFGYLFQEGVLLDKKLEWKLAKGSDIGEEEIQNAICKYGFDYFPPTRMSLTSLGIPLAAYTEIIDEIKNLNHYDYIIVDMMSELLPEMIQLMGMADYVVCIGGQHISMVERMRCFIQNMDIQDMERFIFVCNQYQQTEAEHLTASLRASIGAEVKEYIPIINQQMDMDRLQERLKEQLEQLAVRCI